MTYHIEVKVPSDKALHENLQDACNSGVAGLFNLQAEGKFTTITFDREQSEDDEYIESFVCQGMLLGRAACEQLAREFECVDPKMHAGLIEVLRSPEASVRGLESATPRASRSASMSL